MLVAGGAVLVGAPVVEPTPVPGATLGKLAYAVDGDIFLADWDGSNPVRIADGLPGGKSGCGSAGFWAEGPMWSPDGRHLAYRSPRSQVMCDRPEADSIPTVLIADPDGHVVMEVPGVGWRIPWSPDSTRFATWLDMYPSTKIGVYGLDGTRTVLSLPPSLYGTTSWDNDPAGWSDDGESILVGQSAGVIWELPVDGGTPQRRVNVPRYTLRISRSPDGARVAYVSEGTIFVAAADGSDPREMASGTSQEWWGPPVWSPTGDRIAYVDADRDLGIIDVTSGELTDVVRMGDDELTIIEFSPEGDRVLLSTHEDSETSGSIWSVSASGSEPQLLVSGVDWYTGDWQSLHADRPSSDP
jgi:Tol biopolymer transport system component